jgi:hypothetical protein
VPSFVDLALGVNYMEMDVKGVGTQTQKSMFLVQNFVTILWVEFLQTALCGYSIAIMTRRGLQSILLTVPKVYQL